MRELPPEDKQLTLKELVAKPEGAVFEYWSGGSTYGTHNPLTLGSDGFPIDKDGDICSWHPRCIYALAPKIVKRY